MERTWAQRKGVRRKFNAENRMVTQFATTVERASSRRCRRSGFVAAKAQAGLGAANPALQEETACQQPRPTKMSHCENRLRKPFLRVCCQHELATGRFAGDCGFGRWIVFMGTVSPAQIQF